MMRSIAYFAFVGIGEEYRNLDDYQTDLAGADATEIREKSGSY